MSAAVRLIRGLAALAMLVGVVIGVPVLLATWHLVPLDLPSVREVLHTLSIRDDGQLLRLVLAAGVWICWALFTASTIAEVVALARARPSVPLPGLRAFQRPAAALLAAVAVGLTLAPAVSAASAAGNASQRPPLPAAVLVSVHPVAGIPVAAEPSAPVLQLASVDRPVSPTQTYEVVRRDTLWGLAECYLGNPLRYTEIIELNAGLIGPDNRIVPGTVLVMPADAAGLPSTAATAGDAATGSTAEITVEPGDTLWGIAEESTGDGHDWQTVWAANRGRVETGGVVFEDPDVIRPGWTLTVPSQAQPGPQQVPPATSVPTPQPEPEPAPPAAPEPTAASGTEPTSPSVTPPGTAGATTVSPDSTRAATTNAAPSQQQGRGADEGGTNISVTALAVGGGGGLLAGVSLIALNRYRRQQFRRRRPGRLIGSTPPELVPVERALVSTGTADVSWLDRALRSLVQGLASVEGAALPDVVAVCMTDNILTLVLTQPAAMAPEPWTVDERGTRWSVRRDDPLTYDESMRGRSLSPFPALASVGYTEDGEQWLLDLERVSVARLTGDPDRALDLLRFLAAELAHNTWSEMLQVTVVGFGKELAEINPDRLTCADDVEPEFGALARRRAAAVEAMQVSATDVLTGRLHDVAADAWAPHVLLVAPDLAPQSGLSSPLLADLEAQTGRSGVAVVVAAGRQETADVHWTLILDAVGGLSIPALGLELRAQQLPVDEAGALAQALALAADPDDRAIPPARGTDTWDAESDACGGLRFDAPAPGVDASARSSSSPGSPAYSVLPLGEQTYLDSAATTAGDVRALAPVVEESVRLRVERADPALDQDLAAWFDAGDPRPKLSLLGPVRVRAQGKLPERNPRRQFYTEVVAYLATRNGGAISEQYATAIWPDEPDVVGKTKVRQAISVVRAWLGADPETGADYLPSGLTAAAAGRYRIHGVLIDAELFRRLRVRGLTRGPSGIADLETALALVTGRPFDVPVPRASGAGGYGWLIDADSRLDHEYAAMIVDVAHVVATHHLGAGDPQLAAAAAEIALRSGTFEDIPLLDLVAACDALGNRAEADAYVARILANHDAEVEEDLPPRTASILHRRSRRTDGA